MVPLIEDIIRHDTGKELSHWFPDEINNVTIYQLTFMTSGVPELNDGILEHYERNRKGFEFLNPYDYFNILEKGAKFKFKPGHGFEYCSINYLLL